MVKNITLYNDNKISITLTKNAKSQYCTKHINMQYHYIEKLVNKREFVIKQILNFKILANAITKALLTKMFKKYYTLLGIDIN